MAIKNTIIDLPMELISDIFSWLPVKSLMRFKCISKYCFNLINSEAFVKLHLNHSKEEAANGTFIYVGQSSLHSFDSNHPLLHAIELYCPEFIKDRIEEADDDDDDDDDMEGSHVKLVGSFNGLVCFYECTHYRYSLYNPATRAYNQLPFLAQKMTQRPYSHISCSGDFAYDCVADDYKVFNFFCYAEKNNIFATFGEESHVYSLRSNSWTTITHPPLLQYRSHGQGVVTNNFLHWIGNYSNHTKVIMRLDVSKYTYDIISLPKQIISRKGYMKLGIMRGHLHVITCQLDIWVWKEYGVEESWTRLFRISPMLNMAGYQPLPFAYSKDGRKILVWLERWPEKFIWYDLHSQEASLYTSAGLPENGGASFSVKTWVKSLVSPKFEVSNTLKQILDQDSSNLIEIRNKYWVVGSMCESDYKRFTNLLAVNNSQ